MLACVLLISFFFWSLREGAFNLGAGGLGMGIDVGVIRVAREIQHQIHPHIS